MMRLLGRLVQEKEEKSRWRWVSPVILGSLGSSKKASLVESQRNVEN